LIRADRAGDQIADQHLLPLKAHLNTPEMQARSLQKKFLIIPHPGRL